MCSIRHPHENRLRDAYNTGRALSETGLPSSHGRANQELVEIIETAAQLVRDRR